MSPTDPAAPKPPRPPEKPEDYECCQRGCSPCIFDYYWDALERWENLARARGFDPDQLLKDLGRTR